MADRPLAALVKAWQTTMLATMLLIGRARPVADMGQRRLPAGTPRSVPVSRIHSAIKGIDLALWKVAAGAVFV
jgi:hypothetical protein